MNPWSINPTWQNFASLYREAAGAREAPNDISKFHHLTAALYFGVATIEAFLNQQMRRSLAATESEERIFHTLRYTRFVKKFEKWPSTVLGSSPAIAPSTMDLLRLCNDIRGDLTHPKTSGRDIYGKLESINPEALVLAVAEYCVRFLEVRREVFPYWFLGWNYLNPRPNTHEIIVIGGQQFSYSLCNMGYRVPYFEADRSEAWRRQNMSSFDGYLCIKQALDRYGRCEPKHPRFPHMPILCARWWTEEHYTSCGHVTQEAIQHVLDAEFPTEALPGRDSSH